MTEVTGKPYRPSNGTEGECFQAHFCDHCVHETWRQNFHDAMSEADENALKKCEILTRSFVYDVSEPEYPKEWTYDSAGLPVCTAFEEAKER